jgi:hypothetical protein
MPRPLTYTSTFVVPRSMPMYLENTRDTGAKDTRRYLET